MEVLWLILYLCSIMAKVFILKDKIMMYTVNAESGKLTPAAMPFVSSEAGAGPRHFVIHPQLPFAYSVEELSNTVAWYKVNAVDGGLSAKGRINMLSDNIHSAEN